MNAPSTPGDVGHHDNLLLLLVEDNAGDAFLITEQLNASSQPHVDVVHVEQLDAALYELQAQRYDAVLLDLGLPDSIGVESVRRLTEVHSHLPIVVLTGEDADIAVRAIEAGAQDYLNKGVFSAHGLLKSVLYAVERCRWQEQLQQLVTKNADAMLVVDKHKVIRHANRAAGELFGSSPKKMTNLPFQYPLEDGQVELRVVGQRVRHAELRCAEMTWAGSAAWVVSIRDVTERNDLQALEREVHHANRLASIGRLAASVAHEVNNPAAFVQLNLEVLGARLTTLERLVAGSGQDADGATPAEVPDMLSEMRQMIEESLTGVDQISATVRALSSFVRAPDDEPKHTVVNLATAVQQACKIVAGHVKGHAGVSLRLEQEVFVRGDHNALVQVIINLLVNAADAVEESGAAGGHIDVSTARHDNEVTLSVSDTGCGIPAEHLERVQTAFFTTKEIGRGTGLGLAIASDAVRSHGGTLTIRSVVDVGTTVDVVLPAIGGPTQS